MAYSTSNDLIQRRRGRPRIPGLNARILESAIRLFNEKGFADVSIEEVATHAAAGKGSIYREFGSKEALYAAAMIEGFRQLHERITNVLRQQRSIQDSLGAIVKQATEYFWDHQEFFTLLRDPTALPPSELKRFRRERARLAQLIGQVLRNGAASGVFRGDLDVRLVTEAILGMIRGIRRHRRPAVTPNDAVDTVMALLEGGCLVSFNVHDSGRARFLAFNGGARNGPPRGIVR